MKVSCATSLDFRRIANQFRQQTHQLPLVFRYQQTERLVVAALGAFDKLLINFAIAHGRVTVT